jgi:Flp pilus assembly protein protease CpaA
MLTFVLCEGVLVLRKITITVDDVTLDCLHAMRELNGVPYSAAIRLAVLAYYQDKFATPPAQKK